MLSKIKDKNEYFRHT